MLLHKILVNKTCNIAVCNIAQQTSASLSKSGQWRLSSYIWQNQIICILTKLSFVHLIQADIFLTLEQVISNLNLLLEIP